MKPKKRDYVNVIPIKFSEEDKNMLSKEANSIGLKLSTYVRMLAITNVKRKDLKKLFLMASLLLILSACGREPSSIGFCAAGHGPSCGESLNNQ